MDSEDGDETTPPASEDEGGGSGSAGGASAGANGGAGEGGTASDDEDEEMFDVALAASHSYMGSGLSAVGGRVVLEAGWAGRVPCVAHTGAVFPGETVPLLLPRAPDAAAHARAIHSEKLFGLLCPDESGTLISGYGVLCEVYEAGESGDDEGVGAARGRGVLAALLPAPALSFKARATQRCRFRHMPKQPAPVFLYSRLQPVEIVVLPELVLGGALRHMRLASLDARRRQDPETERIVLRMDAALTQWPSFVYRLFDYRRLRQRLQEYFRTINLDSQMPEEPVSLSFWVASNLALAARDRLALFCVDDALLRLRLECDIIARKSVLCCAGCAAVIARHEDLLPMSSEGVHSNYTNLGGYMHDIVTVSHAANTVLSGAPSAEFSWFPGYTWCIALCAQCMQHVGWRFDATRKSLRPQRFFGLSRNYVVPRHDAHDDDLPAPVVLPPTARTSRAPVGEQL